MRALLLVASIVSLLGACKKIAPISVVRDGALYVPGSGFVLITGSGSGNAGNQTFAAESGMLEIKRCDGSIEPPEQPGPSAVGVEQPTETPLSQQLETLKMNRNCDRKAGTIIRRISSLDLQREILMANGLGYLGEGAQNLIESLKLLKNYGIATEEIRKEYADAVLAMEEKIRALRATISELGGDPFLPLEEDFQRQMNQINSLEGDARAQLGFRVGALAGQLTEALLETIQRLGNNAEFSVVQANSKEAGGRFAYNLLSSFVNQPEVNLEFRQIGADALPPGLQDGENKDESQLPQSAGPTSAVPRGSFALQATETTQAHWFEIMGANPSSNKGVLYCGDYDPKRDICPNLPVDSVSYDAILVFIEKLNRAKAEDLSRIGMIYALPTAEQWQEAVKASLEDIKRNKVEMNTLAWTRENSIAQNVAERSPRAVANRKETTNDLYDMFGNVWEITKPDSEGGRVKALGGSFLVAEKFAVEDRELWPAEAFRDVGFRLVQIPGRVASPEGQNQGEASVSDGGFGGPGEFDTPEAISGGANSNQPDFDASED